MKSVLTTTGTVFLEFKFVRGIGFVSFREIIEVAALSAFETN